MKKRHKGLFVSTLLATIFLVAFSCTFFIYQKQEKQAQSEYRRFGKMYRNGGVLVGLLIVIMLI